MATPTSSPTPSQYGLTQKSLFQRIRVSLRVFRCGWSRTHMFVHPNIRIHFCPNQEYPWNILDSAKVVTLFSSSSSSSVLFTRDMSFQEDARPLPKNSSLPKVELLQKRTPQKKILFFCCCHVSVVSLMCWYMSLLLLERTSVWYSCDFFRLRSAVVFIR